MTFLSSDYPRIVLESSFYWRKHFRDVSAEILSFKISWQAQYLLRLEGDFTCLRALEMTFHM